MMADPQHDGEAQDHTFEEVRPQAPASGNPHLSMNDLRDVRLAVTAELGRSRMLVREVLELKQGSVVALNKLAGEMTDINVNGLPMAKGEAVVIGDILHVRIAEILGATDLPED